MSMKQRTPYEIQRSGIPQVPEQSARFMAEFGGELSPNLEEETNAAIRAACEALRERFPRCPVGYPQVAYELPVTRSLGVERKLKESGR